MRRLLIRIKLKLNQVINHIINVNSGLNTPKHLLKGSKLV